MKTLVTGGLGMIGGHLVDRLIGCGHEVRVLECKPDSGRFPPGSVDFRIFAPGYKIDVEAFHGTMKGIDTVFHLAARPAYDMPTELHRSGPTLTLALLEAAKRAGVQQFVFASSSCVYGREFVVSLLSHPRPNTPAAAAKTAAEAYCLAYAKEFDVKILRYFHVYGPRQPYRPAGQVVPQFLHAALTGKAATIRGAGDQTRYFTYVGDVVEANLAALVDSTRTIHNVYGTRASVLEVWQTINTVLDIEAPILPVHAAADPDELPSVQITSPRTLKHTITALAAGIEKTVPYYRELFSRPG